MMHITTIAILAILIPGIGMAIKSGRDQKKAQYIRDRKGRFMDAKVKMIVPDYKNSFYGHDINYKLSK